MTASESPLGKQTAYPQHYAPTLLHPIARAESRAALGLGSDLPFHGVDIWNAWELSWLDKNGKPEAASAEIRVAADSANIVESKSLKLYLNSFSMSRFESADEVASLVENDLQKCVAGDISLRLERPQATDARTTQILSGTCIDNMQLTCDSYEVDAELLSSDADQIVDATLHSHLLRSLCPVTAQPDSGSVLIEYSGAKIEPASLLRYIVSFRNHSDFHEACVERIFQDIKHQCGAERLTVYARYQRRGGIDINPFRSTEKTHAQNLRLWRQ
ncbi:MAG: NADPH-dependent 7-cyano-7-deazaguanine reductase QueF [Gammaproteobacteria bacterium]|nr:NADPH-dependent 7-cyano-7-deazaguanine reductase QueF [Gammaproteobacteria bacterium]